MSNHQADTRPGNDLVRPFVVAGRGVERGIDHVQPETMVRTTASGQNRALDFERAEIARLCVRPLAVAELAARLGLILGVARTVVAELVEVDVVETFGAEVDEIDDELLERAIDAVRRL